ncbi:hypothetical protein IE53DRAFT_390162, partial [Violaceomyces palustris]
MVSVRSSSLLVHLVKALVLLMPFTQAASVSKVLRSDPKVGRITRRRPLRHRYFSRPSREGQGLLLKSPILGREDVPLAFAVLGHFDGCQGCLEAEDHIFYSSGPTVEGLLHNVARNLSPDLGLNRSIQLPERRAELTSLTVHFHSPNHDLNSLADYARRLGYGDGEEGKDLEERFGWDS